MKKIVLIVLMVLPVALKAAPELRLLRAMLAASRENAAAARAFLQQTESFNAQDAPLYQGFRAMSNFMMSRHEGNTFTKLSYFKEGKKLLEQALQKDPNNSELHYFRFLIQTNAPAFLGYTGEIQQDKIFLLNCLQSDKDLPDKELCEKIKSLLLSSRYCSATEKKALQP